MNHTDLPGPPGLPGRDGIPGPPGPAVGLWGGQRDPAKVVGLVPPSPAGLSCAAANSWDLTGSSGSSRKRWGGWAARAQRRAGECPLSHVPQEHVTGVSKGS